MHDSIKENQKIDTLFEKIESEEVPKGLRRKGAFHEDSNKSNILRSFLMTKRLEGCTVGTLKDYYIVIMNFAKYFNRDVCKITSNEIRKYLIYYQEERGVSNRTLDSMRLTLSSFYNYLEEEDLVQKNPVRKIHKIKYEEVIKKPYSDEELELIRSACKSDRERAIINFLASSGVRVSELIALNKSDINMQERECIVFGKGQKERTVYFDIRTKIYLENYLRKRTDSQEALFITERNGICTRITRAGVEFIVSDIGKRAGVPNVHPHRFRRTFATKLIDRGVPIEQVQMILGHSKIETTLIYAQVSQKNVKSSHTRYI